MLIIISCENSKYSYVIILFTDKPVGNIFIFIFIYKSYTIPRYVINEKKRIV